MGWILGYTLNHFQFIFVIKNIRFVNIKKNFTSDSHC